MEFRVGTGYDVHRIVKNRKLILGGVEFESEFGLDGHSDADVLVHAIMDSLLGGASLKDIGYYFPPNDSKYRGISSLLLLERVNELLIKAGYSIINIDSVLIAEQPKIVPFVDEMKENIGKVLEISSDRIGIKATTNEKIGFIGRGEGIASLATSMLKKEG